MHSFNRRDFLKLATAGGATVYLSSFTAPFEALAASANNSTWLSEVSPIDRSLPEIAPAVYYADDPTRAHGILWNKKSFLEKNANNVSINDSAKIVIVGGGISGLLTAYLLRKHKPIILEQAARFGGNCKGQSWRGIDYALGAAYICQPEAGSDIANLLNELGILKKGKIKKEEDPVYLNSKIYKSFWSGESAGSDEKAKAQFKKFSKYFSAVNGGEEFPFPDIPIPQDEQKVRDFVYQLDALSFREHLEKVAGERLIPQIETAIEHYSWSSLGASSSEISAAAGLNFYAAEFGNLLVYPGGNAAIAEHLLGRLAKMLPKENLRTGALVYQVKVEADGCLVSYQNSTGQIYSIKADTVVMACPKFIAAKLIDDLEPSRLEAIRKIRYRSYLVANVLISKAATEKFYDLYLLGNGNSNSNAPREASKKQGVTDVIFATYAKSSKSDTVLSLYRALPYDGARAEIFLPDSYSTFRKDFEKQIYEEILPTLKFAQQDVKDIRIARWGHPLPVASPGLLRDGTLEKLSMPFKERAFFIEQDNWALPAFETAATEAINWSKIILKKHK